MKNSSNLTTYANWISEITANDSIRSSTLLVVSILTLTLQSVIIFVGDIYMKIEKISKNGKDIILEKLENGCMICTSHCKDKDGYVRIRRNGKHDRLHRIIYEMNRGEIPLGMVVRHKCDNPSCCNIDHLEIGTQKDNVNDMIIRGRSNKGKTNIKSRGIYNNNCKLTEEQVKEIYLSNLGYRKLSKIYNVSTTNISNIKCKRQWRWLTKDLDNVKI